MIHIIPVPFLKYYQGFGARIVITPALERSGVPRSSGWQLSRDQQDCYRDCFLTGPPGTSYLPLNFTTSGTQEASVGNLVLNHFCSVMTVPRETCSSCSPVNSEPWERGNPRSLSSGSQPGRSRNSILLSSLSSDPALGSRFPLTKLTGC